jgi:hypothetical protein
MANCPNCGSDHIVLKQETNVSWGRAAAGWLLFGAIGGAVAAVTGEDRNANACLNCGTSWKAADLHKVLQAIQGYTGAELNLSREPDRLYLNSFVAEVSPYLTAISEAEKKAEGIASMVDVRKIEKTTMGCSYGCVTSVVGLFVLASTGSIIVVLVAILAPPLIGFALGRLQDLNNRKTLDREREEAKKEADKAVVQARGNFERKLTEFITNYPLP